MPEAQQDVYPKMDDTERDVHTHYLHDIVIVTQRGASLSDAAVRRAMAGVDPNMPVNFIRTLRDQVSVQFGQQRLIARLTSLFGILSLALASIGREPARNAARARPVRPVRPGRLSAGGSAGRPPW